MSEHPPSYSQATGSSTASTQRLQVPGGQRSSIPLNHRRSMQDEARSLPAGWVRQYDSKSDHQYFVDTNASPARSIWHHPYDDDVYLKSLSSEERERIEELQRQPPSREEIIAAESDIEDPHHEPKLPPRPSQSGANPANQAKGSHKWGRKLKDKVTGTTHEQREAERIRQHQMEEEMYRRHIQLRQAMAKAMETGEPQFVGKDEEGHEVYIEPPRPNGMYGSSARYYNPYSQGPYQHPNARFVPYPVPQNPYNRPYGYGGYGGYGMGLPLMGGLLGGAMLGGLMF